MSDGGHSLARDPLNGGPLESLLADSAVTEVMVNGASRVYVERDGRIERTAARFADDEEVLAAIDAIVKPLGRTLDAERPYVDARLPDGSRVNAIVPPLALDGPVLTIRKFARRMFTADDFVSGGTWSRDAAEFLRLCVLLRKNIVVSGGTSSGKTTLLNVLSMFIPPDARIITVEDAAELQLAQEHVVRLEARPADAHGRGEVTIRDLVRNCLRMRPDRIVVGECRGAEALDMLQAMNTGHDGSMTTMHANSPRDVVSRLETMVLAGGVDLPPRAVREQIANAVDVVVHVARLPGGRRRVTAISEVTGIEDGEVAMRDIFVWRQIGTDVGGNAEGEFHATGAVPTFYEQFAAHGLECSPTMFERSLA